MSSSYQNLTFGPATTLQQDIASFAPFDPALGTLTLVTINVQYDYTPAIVLTSVVISPGAVTMAANIGQHPRSGKFGQVRTCPEPIPTHL